MKFILSSNKCYSHKINVYNFVKHFLKTFTDIEVAKDIKHIVRIKEQAGTELGQAQVIVRLGLDG